MQRTFRLLAAAICLASLGWPAPAARAAVIINVLELGGDVVANSSGTLNLSALTNVGSSSGSFAYFQASVSGFGVGPTFLAPDAVYVGTISGPASFGSGGYEPATSGSGDFVGVDLGSNAISVAPSYVSGSSITNTTTWSGITFASLGLTPGTYVYSWGSGGNADSITLQIGPAAVPEPSAYALAGLVAAGWGALRLRKRSRA